MSGYDEIDVIVVANMAARIKELEATVSELEEEIETKSDRILELEAELEAVDRVKQEFYYRVVTTQLDTPEECFATCNTRYYQWLAAKVDNRQVRN